MKKKTRNIILSIIITIIILAIAISWYIGEAVFSGSTQLVSNEDTTGYEDGFWDKYGMNYDEFVSEYTIEKLEIQSSFDKHVIPADYIYSKDLLTKDNDTVILVHGLGGNKYSNYPVAKFFLENGYNVITYDQRSSGENTAKYTTFGYMESEDLKDYISYVKDELADGKVGLWGTSFGGATIGIALGNEEVNKIIDFAILDCPVSNMAYMIKSELVAMKTGLPTKYMQFCGNIINKAKLGFSYSDADVCKTIKRSSVPVLIFNSKADTLTPEFMGKDIYDAISHDDKKIITVDDSKHADIWLDYNELYKESILQFINN